MSDQGAFGGNPDMTTSTNANIMKMFLPVGLIRKDTAMVGHQIPQTIRQFRLRHVNERFLIDGVHPIAAAQQFKKIQPAFAACTFKPRK